MFMCMYAFILRMTKIISISDEAYDRLKRLKGKRSFTQTILALTDSKKKSPLEFAGMWEDKPEFDEIYREILEERSTRKEREVPPGQSSTPTVLWECSASIRARSTR